VNAQLIMTPEIRKRIEELRAKGIPNDEILPILLKERDAATKSGESVPQPKQPQQSESAANEASEDKSSNANESPKTEWQSNTMPANKFSLRKASGMSKKRIKWLWPDRIPLSMLTTWVGMPGEAKGLMTVETTAVITTNRDRFIDGTPNTLGRPRDVLFISSEDDFEDTINPRLVAAGADLNRVHFLTSRSFGAERLISLDTDLTEIERCLREHPDIVLVVIDPVLNHLGKKNANANQEVRSILARLKFPGVATVIVLHMNKKQELNAIQRASGAGAFIEVARAAWLFTSDPGDPKEIRKMLLIKCNVTKRAATGMEFKVVSKPVALDDGVADVPFIAWVGTTSQTANDAVASDGKAGNAESSALKTAVRFLDGFLKAGRKPQTEVEDAAEEEGISPASLKRAKKVLQVQSIKADGVEHGEWYWELFSVQEVQGGQGES
jgi:putative DNA primase/helicase